MSDAPSTERLDVLVAMPEPLVGAIFPDALRARLDAVADVDWSTVLSGFSADDARLSRVQVLLTSWGAPLLDARALALMPRLRAVVHAAGSVKHHLGPEVWDRGVAVTSAAEVNALPVADYTLAAVLFAGKRVFRKSHDYAQGVFGSDVTDPRMGNTARTVGIIGASRVGRALLPMLARHGFRLLVSDPTLDDARIRALLPGYPVEPADLMTMMREADVVSLHAPELPETHHLIDDRMLSAMRDGAVLINTSRGSLVDTEALTRHCASGRIDAVLDVTDPEPLPREHPLFALPNVLITPHVAGALGSELQCFGDFSVRQIERLSVGLPLEGQVTSAELGRIA
ncbi:hydroxyacid dehydrogenase [Microbacterium capsulatum]|uniref:Hydroxyacid dehydrogenase n=1 Tax=Microbacterium capsulatum TaxID=3041921 RepID=A0ABU0XJ99_9MICO|nr:hydroxyacid dehydrogenase [Microbacterium sp. ASV81]MDQ4215187.1 hydroxyacid dehydrogenase [Microbacterium sp. ASV81]